MSAEVKGRALGMRLKYSESRKLLRKVLCPTFSFKCKYTFSTLSRSNTQYRTVHIHSMLYLGVENVLKFSKVFCILTSPKFTLTVTTIIIQDSSHAKVGGWRRSSYDGRNVCKHTSIAYHVCVRYFVELSIFKRILARHCGPPATYL